MAPASKARPPVPTVLGPLTEPLKRYHDEAWHTPQGRLVRELIFGLNDGVISTVGFLAGVTATLTDMHSIALAGMAAAFAGGVAMAMGAFVASKSQSAFFRAEIAREAWEIENMPEHERDEIRDMYSRLGFTPEEVEMIVRRVTSNPKLWLHFMASEELGLAEEVFDSPLRVAIVTGVAYLTGALLMLVPYFVRPAPRAAFIATAVFAVLTLLVTGAAKTWLTKERPLRAGIELAGLGILATLIGLGLGWLVGAAV